MKFILFFAFISFVYSQNHNNNVIYFNEPIANGYFPNPDPINRYYGYESCMSSSGRYTVNPYYQFGGINTNQGRIDIKVKSDIGSWIQSQIIDDGWPNAMEDDRFGYFCKFLETPSSSSVELYVGSSNYSVRGMFLYKYIEGLSTEFEFVTNLNSTDVSSFDSLASPGVSFGQLFDVTENYLVMGDQVGTYNSMSMAGIVTIYERIASPLDGSITFQVIKVASGTSSAQRFGIKVTVCGDLVAIADFDNDVRILSRNEGGFNNWGSINHFSSGSPAGTLHFAYHADRNPEGRPTLYIGQPYFETTVFGTNSGNLRYYDAANSTASYTLTSSFIDDVVAAGQSFPDLAADGYFGISSSVSGDRAVVGASAVDDNTGRVYVLAYDSSNSTWVLDSTLSYPSGLSNEDFGNDVDCSDDCTSILVTSFERINGNPDAGSIFYYELGLRQEECTAIPTTIFSGNECTEECPLGFSCHIGGIQSLCPAGSYSDSVSSTECTGCPANTYNYLIGSTSASDCLPCPSGWISTVGSSSCEIQTPCPAGSFGAGVGSCTRCPEDTFNNLIGSDSASDCLACPDGWVSTTGSSTCTYVQPIAPPVDTTSTTSAAQEAVSTASTALVVGGIGVATGLIALIGLFLSKATSQSHTPVPSNKE